MIPRPSRRRNDPVGTALFALILAAAFLVVAPLAAVLWPLGWGIEAAARRWKSSLLLPLLLLGVSCCSPLRPLSRGEYGYTRIQTPSLTTDSQYVLAAGGYRLPVTESLSVDMMAGPIFAWGTLGGEEAGLNLTPSLFYFSPDLDLSLLLELDVALYPGEDYENTSFLLLSVTKEW